ncbi:MAG TPA: hypothetical protein VFD43_06575, partial [Planctomycetota bacterium]|nr:hypothetical protein [Planctomycetota bacterium]
MRFPPTTRRLALAALACGLAAACAGPAPAAAGGSGALLDPDRLETWVEHLAPQPSELAWEGLPWLTSYSDGVLAAQEQRRPLLLWVMNGHPLGCT